MHKKPLRHWFGRKENSRASLTQPNICPPNEEGLEALPGHHIAWRQSKYSRETRITYLSKLLEVRSHASLESHQDASSLHCLYRLFFIQPESPCCDWNLSPLSLSLVKAKNINHNLFPLIIHHILITALCPIADFFLMNHPWFFSIPSQG